MQHETEWKKHAGSIGKLLPNVQARLVLDDGVTDAPMGEAGEIWIKGPNVMKVCYLVFDPLLILFHSSWLRVTARDI
jgi:acyl-CoA synthetase (AMP-forming)/AMP-acid ligase II